MEPNHLSQDKQDEGQSAGSERILVSSGRERLCERVEQRLASLQKRCTSSRQERRWLPGL